MFSRLGQVDMVRNEKPAVLILDKRRAISIVDQQRVASHTHHIRTRARTLAPPTFHPKSGLMGATAQLYKSKPKIDR